MCIEYVRAPMSILPYAPQCHVTVTITIMAVVMLLLMGMGLLLSLDALVILL